MPTKTKCTQAADALHRAFLVNLVTEIEASIIHEREQYGRERGPSTNSDSDSSNSDSDTSDDLDGVLDASSSSDESESTHKDLLDDAMELYLDSLAELYSQRYLAERTPIPKSLDFIELLLGTYKESNPDIFRSYLCINPVKC
ncbi:unnamed protein product [Mycena citricolor]|uniref:Uncharacterized protein n=1 Tax=Mycena citricolor TaxID=2018698 RepID=A0AAD2HW13_9AGAR|nr:unnamed protein product [Mycena citricolor]